MGYPQDPKLVDGLVAINFIFSIYWVAFIIPIDELIFFRGVAQPPTSQGLSFILIATLDPISSIHEFSRETEQWQQRISIPLVNHHVPSGLALDHPLPKLVISYIAMV